MTGGAPLPVGVVGVGSLGFHHARILREVPRARMVGIFDEDPARAEAVARELAVPAFPTLEGLLDEIEAMIVAVPTVAHHAVAMEALRRGVHLLIEKPLATNLAQADEIVALAAERGLLVATGHVERFNSALRAAEQYVSSPRFVESHRLAPFNPRGTDVAVVLDLMIHDIDLVLSLLRTPVVQVDAVGVPVLTPSVDIANARLRFEGGAVANITASRVSRDRMRKIRLFQPSGYLSLDLGAGTGEFLRIREGVVLGGHTGEMPQLSEIVERVELGGDGKEPLRAELESFVAAVQGAGKLVVSGEDGRRALAVALEIMQRSEEYVTHSSPS